MKNTQVSPVLLLRKILQGRALVTSGSAHKRTSSPGHILATSPSTADSSSAADSSRSKEVLFVNKTVHHGQLMENMVVSVLVAQLRNVCGPGCPWNASRRSYQ